MLRRIVGGSVVCWLAVAAASAATFTVVNTKNAGGGSLRDAMTSANGTPGSTVAFAIPTTDSGYNAATGVFTIKPANALPTMTSAGTIIDGTTQATTIGNTNTKVLGVGGTVGVDGLTLSTVAGPEIQLQSNGSAAIGIDVQAPNVTIRGIAISGYGKSPNSNSDANIRVGGGATGTLIEKNVIGAPADTFTDPGAGNRSNGDNIRVVGGTNGTIRNNLIGFSDGLGIALETNANGWLIENNEIRGNGIGSTNLGAIDVESSASATVRGNLLTQSAACGVDNHAGGGSDTVQNNTISGNGTSVVAGAVLVGVRVYGAGSVIDRNIVTGNGGAGVEVTAASSANTITRNAVYLNGTIGIDLLSAADNENQGTSPYVTKNDPGDGDTGGNGLLNFPVFDTTLLSGTQLSVTGWARPGSTIELFVSDGDASGFGEGQTYVATATEGSGADLDGTTGTYPNPQNGLSQGTDTTNRFKFTLTVPGSVAVGTKLTATATLAGATSEFSGVVTVLGAPALTLVKAVSPGGNQPPGADLGYTVTFTNASGSAAVNPVVTDARPAATDFKVGSASANLGTTGLTVVIAYSNDNGATWTYTPVSAGGGAPAGYDRNVTNVRWSFTGNLSSAAPGNAGSTAFTARIR